MNDLAQRVLVLYPQADMVDQIRVEDCGDGTGPRIVKWDYTLGSQPTEAELLAVVVPPPHRPRPLSAIVIDLDTALDTQAKLRTAILRGLAMLIHQGKQFEGIDGTEPIPTP